MVDKQVTLLTVSVKSSHTMGNAQQPVTGSAVGIPVMGSAAKGCAKQTGIFGAQQVVDDPLRNILTPCDGSMDLLVYYNSLRDAGFTNNAKLRALTAKTLKEKKIKMKPFHEKELLKRIANYNKKYPIKSVAKCATKSAKKGITQ
eukprot:945321_1